MRQQNMDKIQETRKVLWEDSAWEAIYERYAQ